MEAKNEGIKKTVKKDGKIVNVPKPSCMNGNNLPIEIANMIKMGKLK